VGACRGACRAGLASIWTLARRPRSLGGFPPSCGKEHVARACCSLLPGREALAAVASARRFRHPRLLKRQALRRLRGEAVGTGVPGPMTRSSPAAGGEHLTDHPGGPPAALGAPAGFASAPSTCSSGWDRRRALQQLPPDSAGCGMRQPPVDSPLEPWALEPTLVDRRLNPPPAWMWRWRPR